MTRFQGFKTRKEANEFIAEHGGRGVLCYRKSETERWAKNPEYYYEAVVCGGLDEKKYPYEVEWRESSL